MIIIDVSKERDIESALKVYKSRVLKSKQIQILKDRQTHVKPSVAKRKQKPLQSSSYAFPLRVVLAQHHSS